MRTLVPLVAAAFLASGCTATHHARPNTNPSRPPKPVSYIQGELLTVQPVLPNRTGPLTIGTAVITGTTTESVPVDRTGHFQIAVPPGVYTVSGSVPVAHPDFLCEPKHGVTVTTGATVTVDVKCPSDAG